MDNGNSANRTATGWTQSNALGTQTTTGYAQTATNGNCWYPYQQQWYYPYYSSPKSKSQEVDDIIAIYKREFGREWKKYFAQLKIEL